MQQRPFRLGARRPLIIAGPCSAETEEQTLATCEALAREGCVDVLRAGIWKPRTQPGSFEGVGPKGLAWLAEAKRRTGLPVATEVGSARHAEQALAAGVDLLWIGARTTVNPFLVQEIADATTGSDACILIKNPMHPDVALWAGAVARFEQAGIPRERIGLIHRGFSTGTHGRYRNDPMWHLAFDMQSRFPGMMMLGDPSHICGTRRYLQEVAQTAANLNYDGLIVESHCDPDCAWSDKAQQVTPEVLNFILNTLVLRDATVTTESLTLLRQQIDELDNELLEVLNKRMRVSREIGQYKKEHRMPVLQIGRHDEIMQSRARLAEEMGMSGEFMRNVLSAIHEESVRQQIEIFNDRTR